MEKCIEMLMDEFYKTPGDLVVRITVKNHPRYSWMKTRSEIIYGKVKSISDKSIIINSNGEVRQFDFCNIEFEMMNYTDLLGILETQKSRIENLEERLQVIHRRSG